MGELIGIDAATLEEARNGKLPIKHFHLVGQQVPTIALPTLSHQAAAVQHTQQSSQLSLVHTKTFLISELRYHKSRVKPLYLLLVFRLDTVQVLQQADNSRKTQTAQEIDGGIACLIECATVVERVLGDALRIGRKSRQHWTHDVCTLCQIDQLPRLSLRPHHKQSIPNGTADCSWEDLQRREGTAGREVLPYSDGLILLAVEGQ